MPLRSAPINPHWVLEGSPNARNCELSRSADGASTTFLWDCSPGKFRWRYDVDETIHILQGRVIIDEGDGLPLALGPGDVVFFPAGAAVTWTIEEHLRKLAFFRCAVPGPVALAVRILRRGRYFIRLGRSMLRLSSR
jgi:uncharacterized protein